MGYVIDNERLMIDWDFEKNSKLGLNPSEISDKSQKRAWWICEEGHEWEAIIRNRSNGNNCPFCTGRKILNGYNDLATTHPSLAKEWNWQKNNDLSPYDISFGSNKKVWWMDELGHEWEASVEQRTRGNGCPCCSRENRISHKEIVVYYYIKKYFADAISTYKHSDFGTMELDIFIPQISTAIEYDGSKWHQDVVRDLKKDNICASKNINMIRIREPNCPEYKSSCTFIYLENYSQQALINAITSVLHLLHIDDLDIDISRDCEDIESVVFHKIRDNSLSALFPNVAADWPPTKNGTLTSEHVYAHSSKKVWWKCSVCGNEWFQSIVKRCFGLGCSKCVDRLSRAVYCHELKQFFINNYRIKSQICVQYSDIYQCCLGKRPSA